VDGERSAEMLRVSCAQTEYANRSFRECEKCGVGLGITCFRDHHTKIVL
jgi:hypothetical protein